MLLLRNCMLGVNICEKFKFKQEVVQRSSLQMESALPVASVPDSSTSSNVSYRNRNSLWRPRSRERVKFVTGYFVCCVCALLFQWTFGAPHARNAMNGMPQSKGSQVPDLRHILVYIHCTLECWVKGVLRQSMLLSGDCVGSWLCCYPRNTACMWSPQRRWSYLCSWRWLPRTMASTRRMLTTSVSSPSRWSATTSPPSSRMFPTTLPLIARLCPDLSFLIPSLPSTMMHL